MSRWRTPELEAERPPMRIFTRAEIDHALKEEAAANRSKAQCRPPCSPHQRRQVVKLLRLKTPVTHIAKKVGLGTHTVYRIKEQEGL
jgi:DNA invertase Pin-like site-specific DNA recombinase